MFNIQNRVTLCKMQRTIIQLNDEYNTTQNVLETHIIAYPVR